MSQVVTRFAPSPTGALHIGGARTAMFNWAFARGHGGKFILRLEDTDRVRSTIDSARQIIADLSWLDLDWDEGPAPPSNWRSALDAQFDPYGQAIGPHGPYTQSQRQEQRIYDNQIEQLLGTGRAYEPKDEPGIVRFRMGRDVAFDDAVYGHIDVKGRELEDFVIRKNDGYPTFHLAVVVDDALMGVTHVIRGQEHLSNTPKHVALQDALGFDRPIYAHTPSILNPDGSKMSKRDKAKTARKAAKIWLESRKPSPINLIDPEAVNALAATAKVDIGELRSFLGRQTDDMKIAIAIAGPPALGIHLPDIEVADFRRSGYLPDVICNYIALLGWNPGQDIERFTKDFLIEHFSAERVGKANAKFDRDKLLAFNSATLADSGLEWFSDRLQEHDTTFHGGQHLTILKEGVFKLFAEAYHKRSRTLEEPFSLGRFFFFHNENDLLYYDSKAIEKVLKKNSNKGFELLEQLSPELDAVEPWTAKAIQEAISNFATSHGIKLGQVAQPLRVAVSGSMVSPPIDVTIEILGKDSTLAQIRRCLQLKDPKT